MGSVDHDPHTSWPDGLPYSVGNLSGQALLDLGQQMILLLLRHPHLKPPAVHLDNPGQLGEPEHLAAGQVSDGDVAHEGDEVVLAQAGGGLAQGEVSPEHFYVLHHHHLVCRLVEHCILGGRISFCVILSQQP